jgi:serine/threonine protein kinase
MPSVCLPIAIRLKDDIIKEDAILFKKLVGYRIGLPVIAEDRVALVAAIESVVRDLHKRGVVHMDLYLSNIMWKETADGTFSICLIDFDAVHSLGEKLAPAALCALVNGNVSDFTKLGAKATVEHDNLYLTMIKNNIDDDDLHVMHKDDDTADQAAVKKRLDARCTELMQHVFDKHFPENNNQSLDYR